MKNNIFILIISLISILGRSQSLSIKQPVKYLALGDSYTIGQSVNYQNRWPRQLFDTLKSIGYETDTIQFIAQTGWRTDHLINAINLKNPDSTYNLVSLLIGVNNQYQGVRFEQYEIDFPKLLSKAIALAGGDSNQVFVVSIPDYAYTPFGKGNSVISTQLQKYDSFAKKYCDSTKIKFYDITPISRKGLLDPTLVASDGLHPSAKQYNEYVKRILSDFKNLGVTKKKEDKLDFYPTIWKKNEVITINKEIKNWELYDLNGRLKSEGKSRIIKSPNIEGFFVLKIFTSENTSDTYRIKIE